MPVPKIITSELTSCKKYFFARNIRIKRAIPDSANKVFFINADKDFAEGKKQKCGNCNFYVRENEKWGKCQLLANGLVNTNGWCASWVKKA